MPLRREHLRAVVRALVVYGLDISVRGNGTTDPPPGSYTYDEGTVVTIRAIPGAGSVFDHWELDGAYAGTSSTINVTMTAYHAVVAVFVAATYSVTIRAGEGGTTDPAPGTYGPYSYGYSLTVRAIPNAGYRFESWLVDGVTYTVNPLTVTVTKDLSITASFSPVPKSTVVGTVLDAETNEPIVGASVSLDTTSTSTGSDGKYSLTVDAGVYKFTVKAGGYQDYIETVDLTSGGTFTKDVRLSKVPQSIIQGRVTDSAGNPIPQATVTADGHSAVTDVNGNFVLTVPPKTYTVTVVKSGWRTESASVDVSTAGTYTLNFTLTPSQSTIQGTVTDIETGQPIQGATITIDAYSATSNADGSFTLTVPPATYTVTVKKEGYVDWKQTLDVSTPGNYILNVQLTKVKPTINWTLIGVGVVLIMVAYAFTRRKG
jgi:hypothetical protein